MTTQQYHHDQSHIPKHPTGVWVRCVRDIIDGPRANEIVRIFSAEKTVTTPGYSWTQSAHDTLYRVERKVIAYRISHTTSPLQTGIVPISHALLTDRPNGPPTSMPYGRGDRVYIREPGVEWRGEGGRAIRFPGGTPATINTESLSRTLRHGAPHGQWFYQIRIDTAHSYVAIQHYPVALAHLDLEYKPTPPAPTDPRLPPPHYVHGPNPN